MSWVEIPLDFDEPSCGSPGPAADGTHPDGPSHRATAHGLPAGSQRLERPVVLARRGRVAAFAAAVAVGLVTGFTGPSLLDRPEDATTVAERTLAEAAARTERLVWQHIHAHELPTCAPDCAAGGDDGLEATPPTALGAERPRSARVGPASQPPRGGGATLTASPSPAPSDADAILGPSDPETHMQQSVHAARAMDEPPQPKAPGAVAGTKPVAALLVDGSDLTPGSEEVSWRLGERAESPPTDIQVPPTSLKPNDAAGGRRARLRAPEPWAR